MNVYFAINIIARTGTLLYYSPGVSTICSAAVIQRCQRFLVTAGCMYTVSDKNTHAIFFSADSSGKCGPILIIFCKTLYSRTFKFRKAVRQQI